MQNFDNKLPGGRLFVRIVPEVQPKVVRPKVEPKVVQPKVQPKLEVQPKATSWLTPFRAATTGELLMRWITAFLHPTVRVFR